MITANQNFAWSCRLYVCRESIVSKAYLELVVSDVQQWQMQISSIMQYVSKRNQLQADEMQHIWKLRIANLTKQNQQLLRMSQWHFNELHCGGRDN